VSSEGEFRKASAPTEFQSASIESDDCLVFELLTNALIHRFDTF
jgi:hypothetical protein